MNEGVYVVARDPDITGVENVAWCFTDEADADAVVAAFCEANGKGTAWHTYEPVSVSLDDPNLLIYLRDSGVEIADVAAHGKKAVGG